MHERCERRPLYDQSKALETCHQVLNKPQPAPFHITIYLESCCMNSTIVEGLYRALRGISLYGDAIHLTVAYKREWSCGFKPDNKTVPLPAGSRATALSSGCIEPCWMNTSVSRGERLGMSRWSRCRQT
ncbi:hypothetical protein AERO8C_50199 [Aeromonas veronii]|uniref:Uncharacterized protein n=1 Tax=Aeromonas veronii TaxID=654 RepID=A0A653L725_AERVE|nr:hypothetical protein AERO8C_50199 [Aeromonas veronii]